MVGSATAQFLAAAGGRYLAEKFTGAKNIAPTGYQKHTMKRRPRRYRKAPKKGRTVGNINRIIDRRTLLWKSFHHENTGTYSLSGNISAVNKIFMGNYSYIEPYQINGTGQQKVLKATRQGDNVFVDRLNVSVSLRCTHNHTLAVRMIAFVNNAFSETLTITGALTAPTDLPNLFKNWLTYVDEGPSTNGVTMANQKMNTDLYKTKQGKSGLLLDRTFYITPFQGVGAGGAEVDTQSLRQYNFELPIKRWWNYENQQADAGDNLPKEGNVYFGFIMASADPANTSNSGDVSYSVKNALVFKERS